MNENLKPDEIEMLERAEKATNGPWKALRLGHVEFGPLLVVAPTEAAAYGLTLFKEAHQEQPYTQVCADFLFASEARTDLPTILARLANERAKLAIAMEALTFYADDANHESREYIVEASRPEDERYDPCGEEHYDSTPYFEDGGESATTALARITKLEKQS